MTEGQEGMPKIESGRTSEGVPKTEKPISEYSFRETFARRQRLTRQKETTSGDALVRIETEIAQVKKREDFLVEEVEQEGGLTGLDQDLGILRDMLAVGELSPSHLFTAGSIAPQLDNLAGIDQSDPHAGIKEWYYRKNLDEITDDLRKQKKQQVRPESSERVLGDLNVQLGDLVKVLQQEGELHRVSGAAGQPIAAAKSQTAELREIFGRLDPGKEEARWVDVEYSQEFYTRFTPNMEPRFYTEIASGSERGIWDARWRLARAAYVKKVLSAQPEKLCENQDLIELTKEQMETLYRIPGVKFALEWYARAIVCPGNEHKVEGKTVLDCKSGENFEGFRKLLRSRMKTLSEFNVQEEEEEMSLEDRTRLISADAVAWNLIWCSNLVESVDSRYSITDVNGKRYKGEGRHANLAPAVCSDDLRAVFHPQEKFEDKCRKNQEWGNFGRWGLTQTRRINREFKEERRGHFAFEAAKILEDFWRARPGKIEEDGEIKEGIIVKTPECYPITSMKSFWEVFDDKDDKGIKKSLLERLLDSQDINWDSVDADPWKTSYLTIKLRRAVGLFDIFTKESKEGWARALLDIYTRLGTYNVLKDYYRTPGLPEHEAGRLAGIHFHNLKVWAVYAVQGGVGRPQDKEVTDPYSRSRIEVAHQWNRSTHASILRKPQIGYLEDRGLFDKEDLVIMSLQ